MNLSPFKATVALILTGCLSGCFDLKENFVFNGDGTASLTAVVSVSASLLAMAAKKPGDAAFCTTQWAKPANGVAPSFVLTTNAGDEVCTIQLTAPADQVMKAMQAGLAQGQNAQAPAGGAPTSGIGMAVVQKDDGYHFTVDIPAAATAASTSNPQSLAIAASMFAGRSLSWSVTAPAIVSTTGQLSADGKTASFSVPLVDLLQAKEPQHFEVIYRIDGGGFDPVGWVFRLFGAK